MLLLLSVMLNGCGREEQENKMKDKTDKPPKAVDPSSALSGFDISGAAPVVLKLPNELKEISGITVTPDGRLLAVQDESSYVYEINPVDGSIVKKFAVGRPAMKGDFEDIAVVSNDLYLINSSGKLFRFREAPGGEYSDYEEFDTPLSSSYDVEGLCYDSETNSLFLACKGYPGAGLDGFRAVYGFSIDSMKLSASPRFLIDTESARRKFEPSGIHKSPAGGSFLLISSTGNSVIEISKDGKMIAMEKLDPKVHEQPEGIAFLKDGTLVISSEGKSGKGSIAKYPPKK